MRGIEEDNGGVERKKWKVRNYVNIGLMYEIIQEKIFKSQSIKMFKKE